MSSTVNTAFVQQFKSNLETLVQQEGSRLMPCVRVEKITGKYTHFDRLGSGVASEVLTRHGDTPDPLNLAHTRRRVILRTFDCAELVDNADKVRMLIDPTSEYAKSISWALGRQADDIILSALYGNAYATDSDDAQTSVALTAGQVVDEDFNSESNSKLTLAKLREARRILAASDVNLDAEQPIMIISPTDMDALLAITAVTSSDYNTVKTLVNGRVDTFMGFKFIETTRLEQAAHKTYEGFVRCIAFVPSALGVAVGRDMNVRISERDDKRYSTQVYGAMDIGATRIQEEKVVVIESHR